MSPTTWLKGSYKNLVDHFALGGGDIVYLVVTKAGEGTLLFNEFSITQKNFLEFIGHEKYKKVPVFKPIEFSPRELIDSKTTAAHGERFPYTVKWQKANKINKITTLDGTLVPLTKPTTYLDPDEKYIAYKQTDEEEMVPIGGLTAAARKLYGDKEGLEAAKAAQGASPEKFWKHLTTTKGYDEEKQFAISPDNYRKRSDNLGSLDLYPPNLIKLANKYAEDLGSSLVNLYNAVSDLSININKYFIASDKGAGMKAITNADTVQVEANNIIDAPKETGATRMDYSVSPPTLRPAEE